MTERDMQDEPELPTLDQLKRSSIIDYVVDRIEAEADSVEVLEGGEVVITTNSEGFSKGCRHQDGDNL